MLSTKKLIAKAIIEFIYTYCIENNLCFKEGCLITPDEANEIKNYFIIENNFIYYRVISEELIYLRFNKNEGQFLSEEDFFICLNNFLVNKVK